MRNFVANWETITVVAVIGTAIVLSLIIWWYERRRRRVDPDQQPRTDRAA
jgi:hypothetical protein